MAAVSLDASALRGGRGPSMGKRRRLLLHVYVVSHPGMWRRSEAGDVVLDPWTVVPSLVWSALSGASLCWLPDWCHVLGSDAGD